MSFLERLRQEKEAREHAAAEQARLELEDWQRKETARLEEERQRQEYHRLRRQNAESHKRESGIGGMVSELRKLIGAPDYGWEFGFKVPFRLSDEDSVFENVEWDKTTKKRWRLFRGSDYDIYDCREKFFTIEVTPDGSIIFYYNVPMQVLSRSQWLNNQATLEEHLEASYKYPKIHSWEYKEPRSSTYQSYIEGPT